MGFDGYYVKLRNRIVPNQFILADFYSAKLNKEEYAERDANRNLHRDVIAIKPSVKFTIKFLKQHEMDLLLDIIDDALLVSEEDKVNCTCWIPKERRYRTFDTYIPDTEYFVRWTDRKGNPIYTNVELDNRLVCFDIKQLGKQLKKLGMLIVQDQVWNRVTVNRAAQKSTRYFMEEFYLLLKDEQTAAYSVEIWKRFRKWGGIPTVIMQNVKNLLASREVENIFENSNFVLMLNQDGKSEPRFAACQSQGIPCFTSHGQWGDRSYTNIAPGDTIFFDRDLDGSADHVGLVIGTDGQCVYTVKGNPGDACFISSLTGTTREKIPCISSIKWTKPTLWHSWRETAAPPAVCNCTEKCEPGAVNTLCLVCSTNLIACSGKAAEPETEEPTEQPEKNNTGGLFVFLIVALLGGGARSTTLRL